MDSRPIRRLLSFGTQLARARPSKSKKNPARRRSRRSKYFEPASTHVAHVHRPAAPHRLPSVVRHARLPGPVPRRSPGLQGKVLTGIRSPVPHLASVSRSRTACNHTLTNARDSARVVASRAAVSMVRKAAASSAASSTPKTMNLKGATLATAVGKYCSVAYHEGGAEPVAYAGVCIFSEPRR